MPISTATLYATLEFLSPHLCLLMPLGLWFDLINNLQNLLCPRRDRLFSSLTSLTLPATLACSFVFVTCSGYFPCPRQFLRSIDLKLLTTSYGCFALVETCCTRFYLCSPLLYFSKHHRPLFWCRQWQCTFLCLWPYLMFLWLNMPWFSLLQFSFVDFLYFWSLNTID